MWKDRLMGKGNPITALCKELQASSSCNSLSSSHKDSLHCCAQCFHLQVKQVAWRLMSNQAFQQMQREGESEEQPSQNTLPLSQHNNKHSIIISILYQLSKHFSLSFRAPLKGASYRVSFPGSSPHHFPVTHLSTSP